MILRESGEMYLETIYMLSQRMEHVRSIDVVKEMGFSKPSVSHAMGLLKENNYILIDSSGFITLTDEGLAIGQKISERHHVLTRMLEQLGVPSDVAADDACKMEHTISDITFEAIKKHINQ